VRPVYRALAAVKKISKSTSIMNTHEWIQDTMFIFDKTFNRQHCPMLVAEEEEIRYEHGKDVKKEVELLG
jgi:hypothetical protein